MKKSISLLIAVLLALGGTISAAAASYRYGDWLLTADMSGAQPTFAVKSYDGADTSLTVPDNYGGYKITAVSSYAFAANKTVKSIALGDNVTSVGNDAFLSAEALETVSLGASVTEIGESAFSDTPSLKSVNLQDTAVEAVPARAFLNSGINELELPDGCTSIGENAFAGCSSLEKITIPASVTEIADNAFANTGGAVIYAPSGSAAVEWAIAHGTAYQINACLLGDVNGDGRVDVSDATAVQRVCAGLESFDAIKSASADVNGDQVIGIDDATQIQKFAAGLDAASLINTYIPIH